MMKKLLSLLLAVFLLAGFSLFTYAKSVEVGVDAPLLLDLADLLDEGQESALTQKLQQVSDQYGAHVAIVTMPEVEETIGSFAESFYDDGNYGMGEDRAGVLLVVSMNPREYYVFCNGFAWEEVDTEAVGSAVQPYLSSGNYSFAFDTFADECADYLDRSFEFGKNLLISLGIGLLAGFFVAKKLKSQLKTVRKQDRAANYVRPGTLSLTRTGDYFMYRNVTRTERPQSKSSSSGSSRGGSGGSF